MASHVSVPRYVGHIAWLPRVAGSPDEPAMTPLTHVDTHYWAVDDVVILAHAPLKPRTLRAATHD